MLGCAEGVSILGTLVVAAVERLSKWALKTGQHDVRAMHMARCKPQASPQVALLLWCPFDCPACQPTVTIQPGTLTSIQSQVRCNKKRWTFGQSQLAVNFLLVWC